MPPTLRSFTLPINPLLCTDLLNPANNYKQNIVATNTYGSNGIALRAGIIFLSFFCLYMAISSPTVLWSGKHRYGFHYVDRLFDIDSAWTVEEWTTPKKSKRSAYRHPFLTLITRPVGTTISNALNRYE